MTGEAIEQAHRSAVLAATAHLEATAGWADVAGAAVHGSGRRGF